MVTAKIKCDGRLGSLEATQLFSNTTYQQEQAVSDWSYGWAACQPLHGEEWAKRLSAAIFTGNLLSILHVNASRYHLLIILQKHMPHKKEV